MIAGSQYFVVLLLIPCLCFAKWDVDKTRKIKNSKYFRECNENYTERSGNYCFFLSKKKTTWIDATYECTRRDGQLANIEKFVKFKDLKYQRKPDKNKTDKNGKYLLKEENFPLLQLAKANVWIGLSDRTAQGVYKWADGSWHDSDDNPLLNSMWEDEYANEGGDFMGCVTITKNGTLQEKHCYEKYQYLCLMFVGLDEKVIEELNDRVIKNQIVNDSIDKNVMTDIERINNRAVKEGTVFEMDIKLTDGQKLAIQQGKDPGSHSQVQEAIASAKEPNYSKESYKRSVINGDTYRWLQAKVPYTFSPDVDAVDRSKILRGMQIFHDNTCVKLVQRTTEKNYIYIKNDLYECSSYVGMVGGSETNDPGKQELNLHKACLWYIGTVQHELMHALGFWHEHVRPDRDDYIDINFPNIKEYAKGNFKKMVNSLTMNYEYDFGSVMHYNLYSFAIDRSVKTIVPKKSYQATIGQRDGPSKQDIVEINHIYGCNKDGNWGSWSAWSTCTKTCGGGTQQRKRGCNNPEPGPNGKTCPGDATETQTCKTEICPINAMWAGCWDDAFIEMIGYTTVEGVNPILDGEYKNRTSKVNKCVSVAKGTGNKYAILRFNGYCYVDNDDQYTMNNPSKNCNSDGAGTDKSIDVYKLGDSTVPLNGHWSPWVDASCSKTCSTGTIIRSRQCSNPAPANGGTDCAGYATLVEECNTEKCP